MLLVNILPIQGIAGFGTSEAAMFIFFSAFGVDKDWAVAASLDVHIISLVYITLVGITGHVMTITGSNIK
jgi:uncharacterized membrane protein YbhN (UPF0104 family)